MSEKPPYHPKATPTITRAVVPPSDSSPRFDREAETKAACPWCASHGGCGLVPPPVRSKWLEQYPELSADDEEKVVPGSST